MRQARLKLWNRVDAIDVILDNTLLPALAVLALFAYICEVMT